jgi:hypothetical protein
VDVSRETFHNTLFPNAKFTEYPAKDVFGRDLARYFAQGVKSGSELDGEEFRRIPLFQQFKERDQSIRSLFEGELMSELGQNNLAAVRMGIPAGKQPAD